MSEEFLTVVEAAEKLSVSPRTIQRYCKEGRLNYKWVTGKRHRELRIIPPIPVSGLPGVKKKALSSVNIVSSEEFMSTIGELREMLREKDERLAEMKQEINTLKKSLAGNGRHADNTLLNGEDSEIVEKAKQILHDFNKVRPVEKKLILRMAKELSEHGRFLRKLGLPAHSSENQDSE